ncbi:hypothetical protein [Actinoplanes sp. NPDC020271]|uniref:hypothetical protein n=1 Tax=Actinoplanes sp. NPDC020271 TaxID=3363896 RepID=UPI003798CE4A
MRTRDSNQGRLHHPPGKENDLFVPLLVDAGGVSPAGLLDGLHDLIGGDTPPGGGCGCGGCGGDTGASVAVTVPSTRRAGA